MADAYVVTFTVRVVKVGETEALVNEDHIFSDAPFAKMTQLSADFYDLITKLRAKK